MTTGGKTHRTRRNLWLATAAAIGIFAATAANAQGKHVTVPAEDASASIPAVARQAGVQVFAPADVLRGVRTNALDGDYSPQEAFDRLLSGTGLQAVSAGDNAVTIRREEGASSSGGSTVGEVVVTGTRIKRPGFDTLEAALSTNAKEIEQRGYDNIADALQATPGFGIPGSSPLSSGQARATIGQSYSDFFGLGSQRTLTLVNGRRFVSSNTSQTAGSNASPGDQVDLNAIPVGLIDHVEVVSIGGAPVYGSDAIAGTVNIFLKQNYDGVEGSVQLGETERRDGANGSARFLAGKNFADGRGNVIFSAEYNQQDGLVFSKRSGLSFAFPNPANTGPHDGIPASIIASNVTFPFTSEGGLPYDGGALPYPGIVYPPFYPNSNIIRDSSGNRLQFGPNGDLIPFNVGTVVSQANLGPGRFIPVESSGGDGVNAADHFALLSPTKRALFNFNGHYDLDNGVRFFWESSFAHTEATVLSDITSIDAPNLISSGAYALNFSVNNPYLSSQARSIITAPQNDSPFTGPLTSFTLSRNMNDIVDRFPATQLDNVYRLVTGLEGKIHPWGQDWSWDVSADYGTSFAELTDTYINPTNLLLAIDAVSGPGGSIVCASGPNCVPIDLFGQNAFSQKAAEYVTRRTHASNVNTQFDLQANLGGKLPWAVGGADQIAVNVGAEHRQETSRFEPDANWIIGDILDGAPGYGPVSGRFDTWELYGEAKVPLISPSQGNALIKSAEYDGAIRYVDHSITGGATTWSSGGELAPRLPGWGDGLALRGVFTHSIRSPSIAEFGLPQTGVLTGVTDPCDAGQVGLGPDPAVRLANCTAALAAAGAPPPGSFSSTTRSLSQQGFDTGNLHLKNEMADSWSAGFVYQPTVAPRFRLSLDWSNISMKNAIELLGINSILESCYDSTAYPSTPTCSAFTRLTAATLSSDPKLRHVGDIAPGYAETYFNTATLDFQGLILAAQYGFDVPDDLGSINLSATVFYTSKFDELALPGQPVTHEAGTVAAPRERASFNVNWAYRNFETSWQTQWTAKSSIDNTCTIEVLPQCYVPSYVLENASFSYKITPRLKAQLTVDNVFDTKMPFMALYERLFSTYDPLGRRYQVRLSATF